MISDNVSESLVVAALESGARDVVNINQSPDILLARLEATFRDHSRFNDTLHIPLFVFLVLGRYR